MEGTETAVTTSVRLDDDETSLRTAVDVLYINELMRGRLWVAICTLLAPVGIATALVLDAPGTTARLLLAAGSTVVLIASAIALLVLRRAERYDPTLAAIYSYTCLIGFAPALYFFGWSSAVVLLIALGGIVFAMGHSIRAVIAMAIATLGTHATVGALTISGVFADRGLSMIRIDSKAHQVAGLVMCQGLLVMSFVIGRRFRAHSLEGVERYGQAIRESARRGALLQEAHDELRRAQRAGDAGRYTDLVLGSYRLGTVLGRGGMGEVYVAAHVETKEPAAIKVMTAAGSLDERALERFIRELELAAAIDSPHVVRVLETSEPDAPVLYMAMELLVGRDLGQVLRTTRRPPHAEMLAMLRQVARGVDSAHQGGVVHRDLKPHNLFRHEADGEPVWKVLDFGVSKFAGSQQTLTGGNLVGTPGYMSPEQATGRDVDHRSDLFSLGCISYRCLTGQPVFGGGSKVDVLYRVVHEMPLRPSLVAPVPREVDLALAVALAKDPRDRFATATEQAIEIADACRGAVSTETEARATELLARNPWRKG